MFFTSVVGWLRTSLGGFLRVTDLRRRFERISDAQELGDLHTVLRETQRILTVNRRRRVVPRLRKCSMFFNSAEEYNCFLHRNPSQSHVTWEFPVAPEAHFHRALAYERAGRLLSGSREISKSLAEFPDSAKYLVESGLILAQMNRFEEAESALDLAIVNDLTDNHNYQARALVGKAMVRMNLGRFESARVLLRKARRFMPEDREIAFNLLLVSELITDVRRRAEYLLGVAQWQLAAEAFEEALDANPRDYEMLLGIAFVHKESGRLPEAEKHLKKAFSCNPGASEVNFALGWLYLLQGEIEKSEQEILKAVKKNPFDPGYQIGLAHLYLEFTRREQAVGPEKLLSTLRKAARLDPDYVDPHLIRAESYLLNDELDRAQKSIKRALKLAPESQDAHILAAEIFLQSGHRKNSKFHLREASDFGRDTERIRELRERLEGESF